MTVPAKPGPPERLVRHVFWKYPIIAALMLVVVAGLAAALGSPNFARETIAGAFGANPGGAILATTQELDGTAASSGNAAEFGMGDPAETLVLGPLRAAQPIVGPMAVAGLPPISPEQFHDAIAAYDAARPDQRTNWASTYQAALATITPSSADAMTTGSPDPSKIPSLKGDFGPVPVLVQADLYLGQSGFLEQYLQAADPGHSFHLVNLCLYDHPDMLNTAVQEGLTDDQWGMVKERGFPVGPWYLVVPSIIHVELPGGSGGTGFVLWNLAFAAFLLFAVPLLPGLRSLPRYLKLDRFIYRYPNPGDLESPALRERRGTTHGPADQP